MTDETEVIITADGFARVDGRIELLLGAHEYDAVVRTLKTQNWRREA